jgi:hypothetical protein
MLLNNPVLIKTLQKIMPLHVTVVILKMICKSLLDTYWKTLPKNLLTVKKLVILYKLNVSDAPEAIGDDGSAYIGDDAHYYLQISKYLLLKKLTKAMPPQMSVLKKPISLRKYSHNFLMQKNLLLMTYAVHSVG